VPKIKINGIDSKDGDSLSEVSADKDSVSSASQKSSEKATIA
jgi:hypothetical protein